MIAIGRAYPATDTAKLDDPWSVESTDAARTPTSTPRTPTLTPRTMEPEHFNTSADAIERVRGIRWVEVVARERQPGEPTSYTIHIFTEQGHSHLHTSAAHTHTLERPARADAEPDMCIRRRAAEFHALRHDLMDAVEGTHHTLCKLCTSFQALLTFTSARPAKAAWALLPPSTKIHVFNKLLQRVVAQYLSSPPPPRQQRPCQGMHFAPRLLDEFLFGTRPHASFSDSISDLSSIPEQWS